MSAAQVAVEHAECPICLENLAEVGKPVAVLRSGDGRRVCRHVFHVRCMQDAPKTCPICREPWTQAFPVPDPAQDPCGWFDCFDTDGDGSLSKQEMKDALRACLNLDERRCDEVVDAQWRSWTAGADAIARQHMRDAMAYVRHNVPERSAPAHPPRLEDDPEGWFKFWDEDRSGTLERGEVARALLKTFRRWAGTSEQTDLRRIEDSLSAVWGVFDPDNNGHISMSEFQKPDGLAQTLIATMSPRSGGNRVRPAAPAEGMRQRLGANAAAGAAPGGPGEADRRPTPAPAGGGGGGAGGGFGAKQQQPEQQNDLLFRALLFFGVMVVLYGLLFG
eukprot:TRINITY_DN12642_c1_g1_i1.p1 TRINITY_DN12642_c1_g1~~TRINITY_DN12642_c1_g1_i1.p1  ORF type:complete len:361 (+),score=75.87 TRINITY_DN12642_c1_g1_i1:86-1084(+)